MNKRKFYRFFCAALLLIFSLSLLSAAEESPWYMGKRIASFSNTGLQNVDESIILDIQYEYLDKPFSDALFNELQGKLYALDYFLYFLAEAQRTGEGNNELEISMEFHELPYINHVVIEGNEG
ncbi:MAG: outer membrane protein assembly factor BamA, partial [Sphaerochaetaceae bacterium]